MTDLKAWGRYSRGIIVLLVVLSTIGVSAGYPGPSRTRNATAQDAPIPSGDVIVILESEAAAPSTIRAAAVDDGVQPSAVFSNVVDGYAATVTQAQANRLARDPSVAAIFPDNPVYQADQTVEPGIRRIGADTNDIANINGVDQRVDADVAVLDSGIDPNTGDLNVVGGADCAEAGTFSDASGHGTHVAGIIGAIDNNIGAVGVAPGARLWSVRVLNENGIGSDSTLICGLEWVYANRATIEVVNMSLVGSGPDTPCTRSDDPNDWDSPLHEVVCRVTDAQVPIVAAAGNKATNATTTTPATYDEVITVSAMNDYNGTAGGGGTPTVGCSTSNVDDRFASYSNFGSDIDIMAPGTCVRSTNIGGGTRFRTGTSMAAPHVSGAVALYKSQNAGADNGSVRSWLLGAAVPQNESGGILGGDTDGFAEPILKVGLGDIPLATPTPTPTPTIPAPTEGYPLTLNGQSANSISARVVRDGDLGTIWTTRSDSPNPSVAEFYVGMSESRPIGSIRWVFGRTGLADRFTIEISNDLSTWTYVTVRTNKPTGVWQEMRLRNVNARYVRFRFENPNGDARLGGISEVQVWAPGASLTPTPTPTTGPAIIKYNISQTFRTLNSIGSSYVKDSSPATYWRTRDLAQGQDPHESGAFYVSIGGQKPIGVVRWYYALEGAADSVKIDISWDAVTWTPIAIRTNAPLFQWQELKINKDARFVRWTVDNPNNDAVIGGIAEVEVWSAAGGPLSPIVFPPTPTPTGTPTPTEPAGGADVVEGTATPIPTGTPETLPDVTETPIPTETAKEVPTGTPEVTPTFVPTETPVPEVTATEESVVEVTAEPTMVPTDVPDVTAEAGETLEPMLTAEATDLTPETSPTEEVTLEVTAALSEPLTPRRVRTSPDSAPGSVVIDRDPATAWTTTAGEPPANGYVTIDLGTSTTVSRVRWLFDPALAAGEYTIEISPNRTDWVEIGAGSAGSTGEWQELTVGSAVRFVRFSFTNAAGNPQIGGLAEAEVWP